MNEQLGLSSTRRAFRIVPVLGTLLVVAWAGHVPQISQLTGFVTVAHAMDDDGADRAKKQVAFGIEVARIGLWEEAIHRWVQAVELDPDNSSAQNNLAVAYEQAGKFELANEAYERALELSSDNMYIRQNYELFREAYERKKRKERDGANQ